MAGCGQRKDNKKEQLWKKWLRLSKKEGLRPPIYEVNRSCYEGEWTNDEKHGKGVYSSKKSGWKYIGDWEKGKMSGFGTFSLVGSSDVATIQYAGYWKENKRHGFGAAINNENVHYEGEWVDNMYNGWGKMYYEDDSVYKGEWKNGKRHGHGFLRHTNGDRYEGLWENDMKNGLGKYFYVGKGLVYCGKWKNDVPVCGTIEKIEPDSANPLFPRCELEDIGQVLKKAQIEVEQ